MAAVFQAAGALATSTTASITANFDAGAANTDLVFCVVNSSLSTLTMPSLPAGWSDPVGRVVGTDHAAWVLNKVIGAGETSVSITLSGSTTWAAQCFRWTGHDTATPLGDSKGLGMSTASTTITSASVTPQGDNNTLAQFVTVDLAVAYDEGVSGAYFSGYTAGMTERAKSISQTAEFLNIGVADGVGPATGVPVTKSLTQAISDQASIFLEEIKTGGPPAPPNTISPRRDLEISTFGPF